MEEACTAAGTFLESLFQGTGLNIRVAVNETPTECLLDLTGPDAELLQVEGGELLQSVQHLVNQAFGRRLHDGQRLGCDLGRICATRAAQLRVMSYTPARLNQSSS